MGGLRDRDAISASGMAGRACRPGPVLELAADTGMPGDRCERFGFRAGTAGARGRARGNRGRAFGRWGADRGSLLVDDALRASGMEAQVRRLRHESETSAHAVLPGDRCAWRDFRAATSGAGGRARGNRRPVRPVLRRALGRWGADRGALFDDDALRASGMEAQVRRPRHVSEFRACVGMPGDRCARRDFRAGTAGARGRARGNRGRAFGRWGADRGSLFVDDALRASGMEAQVRELGHESETSAHAVLPGDRCAWRDFRAATSGAGGRARGNRRPVRSVLRKALGRWGADRGALFDGTATRAPGIAAQVRRLGHMSETSACASMPGYLGARGAFGAETAGVSGGARGNRGPVRSVLRLALGRWAAGAALCMAARHPPSGMEAQARGLAHVSDHSANAGMPGCWGKSIVICGPGAPARSMGPYSDTGALAAGGTARAAWRDQVALQVMCRSAGLRVRHGVRAPWLGARCAALGARATGGGHGQSV